MEQPVYFPPRPFRNAGEGMVRVSPHGPENLVDGTGLEPVKPSGCRPDALPTELTVHNGWMTLSGHPPTRRIQLSKTKTSGGARGTRTPNGFTHIRVQTGPATNYSIAPSGGDKWNRTTISGFSDQRLDHVGHVSITTSHKTKNPSELSPGGALVFILFLRGQDKASRVRLPELLR